jgi:hypothetical protein
MNSRIATLNSVSAWKNYEHFIELGTKTPRAFITYTPKRGVNPWRNTVKQMAGRIVRTGALERKSVTCLRSLFHVPPKYERHVPWL